MAIWFANPCLSTGTTITVDDNGYTVNINDVVCTNSSYCCVIIFSSAPDDNADYLVTSEPKISCSECTGCTSCQENPTIVATVEFCGIESTTFCVVVPLSAQTNDIITFTTTITPDTLCGTITGFTLCDISGNTGTLVENLGPIDCISCLTGHSVARQLTICSGQNIGPSGDTISIYVSPFYIEGDVIVLDGCYTVGPIVDTVDIPTFIPYFTPYPSCEDCYTCNNGVPLKYVTCDGEFSGVVTTNQVVPTGTTFYHPSSGCCVVVEYSYSLSITDSQYLESLLTFNNCPECQNSTNTIYESISCLGDPFIIISNNNYNPNDIIIPQIASGQESCTNIIGVYTGDTTIGEYYTNYNDIIYTGSCDTCFQDNVIGFPIISCDTNITKYFGLNIYDLIQQIISGNTILQNSLGECYQFQELPPCLFNSNNVPYFDILTGYTLCSECIPPIPPIEFSAGTEYKMCVQDCSGNTISVSVPHPVWTNNQGQTVILLDAVQLGGANGLYN